MIMIFGHLCKNDDIFIFLGAFPYFLKKNYNIVNIKILTFFIGLLQQFFK